MSPPPRSTHTHTLPTTSHACTHATCRTGSYVPLSVGVVTTPCHVSTSRGNTRATPPAPTPTLFDLTWSFIKTGCPEHFTFPSVVQQMCSNGTKDRLGVGERELSLSERHCYQIWPVFFLFSLHVNLHVLTSTLLHRQGDS